MREAGVTSDDFVNITRSSSSGLAEGAPMRTSSSMARAAGLAVAILGVVGSGACGNYANECDGYLAISVADMRNGGKAGCFELSGVVVVARTPSTTAPRLYLQDPAGGAFSAIVAKCSPTSTHSCPVTTVSSVGRLLDGAKVTARGYYSRVRATGFEEVYLHDVVDSGALLPLPEPTRLAVSDLARDARSPSAWFQVAVVDVPETDPLTMYDFSAPDFHQDSGCPAWEGFAMIPASAGAPSAAGCTGETNPPTTPHPDAREVLIGRQFFSTFWASTDCACAAASKQHLLSPTSTVRGTVRGVLVLQAHPGARNAFQVFEPLSRAGFPVTGG